MAYNPGVSFFIPFYELDPSRQKQCIYFTQKGARCKWSCQESDNRRAIALHKTIIATSSEDVSLDLLQEHVLSNCCRSGRAQHRDRIEDVGLLIPLAQRWQDEIRRHAANQSRRAPKLEESIFIPSTYAALPTPPYNSTASPSYYQPNAQTPYTTPSKPIASSSSYQFGSPRSLATTEFTFQPFGSQPHYDLRPREANISTNLTSARSTFVPQAPLSEFRPHVAEPLLSDSVSWKILERLDDRDFETGSNYIFDRDSSPGHVKIGWTASSVSRRLEDWSRCGYTPNLLFSVHDVPHAQRVETLTHHELIKEWRRERMCKASWCRKSHQEWFEISRERAAWVLGDWADFMKIVEPYNSNGSLKNRWREVIKVMDKKGEAVTAKRLLEQHEASLLKEATLVEERVDLGRPLKVEEVVGFGYGPRTRSLETPKEALVSVSEQPIFQKETPLLKIEELPEQTSLAEIPLLKAKNQLKTELPIDVKPVSNTRPPSKVELSFKTEKLPKSEPMPSKDSPLEQIPLPSSPLQSTVSAPDTLSSQETKPSPSTEIEETKVVTKSEAKITDIGTSSIPKAKSLVLPSPPTSLLAITSPSITPSEEITQKNAHTSTETSTSTNSQSPNLSEPSATSASSGPKTDLKTDLSAPLVTEISEALLSLTVDEQEEIAKKLTSTTHPQQNAERADQAKPESKRLSCDGQTREEIDSDDGDESTVLGIDTPAESDEWDADETLVEEDPTNLEKAALEIVDGLCKEISAGEGNVVPKGLGASKVLESEAPPAVQVVAQA